METQRRGRGRPRRLNPSALLDAAIDVFWSKGYAATSLDDVADAAGVSRPSLAAALGDKRAMYLRALSHFSSGLDAETGAAFAADRPIRDALRAFLGRAVELYVSGPTPRGCLIMCTAPAAAVDEADIREALEASTARLDELFRRAFEAAQQRGELSAGPSIAGRARCATALLQSLALRARSGTGEDELRRLVDDGIDLLAT